MADWKKVHTTYIKTNENGKDQKVNEVYLFDAVTFGNSEERALEMLKEYTSSEVKIKTISIAEYDEVSIYDEGGIFWIISIEMVTFDEEKGAEKNGTIKTLLNADDIFTALARIKESFDTSNISYSIVGAKKAGIVDVFPYNYDAELKKAINEVKELKVIVKNKKEHHESTE